MGREKIFLASRRASLENLGWVENADCDKKIFHLCLVLFYNVRMKKIIILVFACGLLAGCAKGMESRLDGVRGGFASQDFASQNIGDSNLDPLLAGNALFQQDRFSESDKAFEDINRRMRGAQGASLAGEAGKALTGRMSGAYKPYFMDDLFVSYYQLWDALADGRAADARVVINQSYAKQQRLSGEFAGLIKSREKDDSGLGAKLRGENAVWESYRDIMNPALTYLAGIYFLNFASGAPDFETARTYLSRAAGMAPDAKFIDDDIALALSNKGPQGIVWVFIESGFAPKLVEKRIDWPIMTSNGIRSVSFAVSDAAEMPAPQRIEGAALIADVDAMFMTEHKEYGVNEALRAFASAASKLALQGVAQDRLGPLGGLGATIYSIATNSAEVRTWATLPKQVWAMRVPKSKDNEGLIVFRSGGKVLSEVRIPSAGNHLVYIRYFGGEIKPKIIKLKG